MAARQHRSKIAPRCLQTKKPARRRRRAGLRGLALVGCLLAVGCQTWSSKPKAMLRADAGLKPDASSDDAIRRQAAKNPFPAVSPTTAGQSAGLPPSTLVPRP